MTESIRVSTDISAPPNEVWDVISDLKRMAEWSPQCRKMIAFGEVREGARTLNINRQGKLFWPTSAKVVRFEPNRAIAWRITENRTVWSYELEPITGGTKLTETRDAPDGVSKVSKLLVGKVMGGIPEFEASLRKGMQQSVDRIKVEVESKTNTSVG